MSSKGWKSYQIILLAGLVAGVLDITAAAITTLLRGGKPLRMLQSIASGLLGLDSYNGGLKTSALGLLLHFIIATGWAAVFYLASSKLEFLLRQAIVSGLLYGIAVYCLMNLVVLPLSAFPHKISFPLSSLVIGVTVLMLCVGLPISLIVRRYSS
ncbi:MAG: hypothetical protein ND895_15110 [Pyrinomonadaceae bacterium]|nr:hypothetical protein [Pyrinomonadaceae bacterium]